MAKPRHVKIGNLTLGNDRPLALIAGPCQLESREHAHEMCHALTELTGKLKGAVHVPRGFLEFKADPQSTSHESAILPDKHLVLYCASGNRSALAAKTLKGMGYGKVAHVAGGFPALKGAGGTSEKPE